MTIQQLTNLFSDRYGLNIWPETYTVDTDTYANVCNHLFLMNCDEYRKVGIKPIRFIAKIALGKNNGIMFKGVELLLEKK